MRTYIVYVDGVEKEMIKAGGHNAAEKKAKKLAEKKYPNARDVSIVYTEV